MNSIKERIKRLKVKLDKEHENNNIYNNRGKIITVTRRKRIAKELIVKQAGLCAICKEQLIQKICVDHCHKTHQVRGLLCHNCNVGLGHFRDNVDLMQQAIQYLYSWERG